MSTRKQLSLLLTVLIGGTSLVSVVAISAIYLMRGQIMSLSRETSPTQVRLAKLQRGFEQISGAFARISASSSQADLSAVEADLNRSMAEVQSIAAELVASTAGGTGMSGAVIEGMKKTGEELRAMAHERIDARKQVAAANRSIAAELGTVLSVTTTLSEAMAQLQMASQETLVSSKRTSIEANSSIKALLLARQKTEQLRSCVQEVRFVDKKFRLNVLRDKARGILDGIASQELPDKTLSGRLKSFTDHFGEMFDGDSGLLALRGAELGAPQDAKAKAASEERQKAVVGAIEELSGQIAELIDPLELAVGKSNSGMSQATELIARVAAVSAAAAEANARARSIQALAWQLLTASDVPGVDNIAGEVARQNDEVDRGLVGIRDGLAPFNRSENAAAVAEARRSFARVRQLLIGPSGVAAAVKSGLEKQREAEQLFASALESIRNVALAGSTRAHHAEEAQEQAVARITQLSAGTFLVVGLVALGALVSGSVVGRRVRNEILVHEKRQLLDAQEMRRVMERLSAGVSTLRVTSHGLTDTSEVVTRNVEAIASSGERMGCSIQAIAASASQASEVGGTAGRLVESAAVAVDALRRASSEIGSVTGMIRSIAFKTNLLALNAAIEAAHSGERGAAFGVVAGEVKNLAAAAADATSEIDLRVSAMTTRVENVTATMTEVASIIDRIQGMQGKIAKAVREQTATTSEIAASIQETAAECRGEAMRPGMHAMALQLAGLAQDLEILCQIR